MRSATLSTDGDGTVVLTLKTTGDCNLETSAGTVTVSLAEGIGVDVDAGTSVVFYPLEWADAVAKQPDDGSFEYTPEADFYGQDSFTYRIADSVGREGLGNVITTLTAESDLMARVRAKLPRWAFGFTSTKMPISQSWASKFTMPRAKRL